MKTIALDMDGVIADTYQQLFDWDEREFGSRRTLESSMGKPEGDVFPNIRKYVFAKDFFRTKKVMQDATEVVEQLNQKYNLYIVSAAVEFPQSLPEKVAWLQEHFSFITWHKIVFCGSKEIVKADIMIDDHYKNLDYFKGELPIIYTQPHNALGPDKHFKRVHNWKEVASLLL